MEPPGTAGAGIGTRGPDETQSKTGRRLIRKRIRHLKQQLQEVRRHRVLYRRRRIAGRAVSVAGGLH